MIQFEYQGVIYNVANHATIQDRLKLRELFELPLEGWQMLLKAVNGKADIVSMLEVLTAKIEAYESEVAHKFSFKGEELWWDKNMRNGFMNLANATDKAIALIINDKIFEINSADLKELLAKLEVYSYECYVLTQKHLLNIIKLQTVEDVIKYDYTLGYPKKVEID